MANSKGSYQTTPELTMAAYDKLPPAARKALQDAVFCWATQPILTYWNKGRRGFKTGPEIALKIQEWDRDHLRKLSKRRR